MDCSLVTYFMTKPSSVSPHCSNSLAPVHLFCKMVTARAVKSSSPTDHLTLLNKIHNIFLLIKGKCTCSKVFRTTHNSIPSHLSSPMLYLFSCSVLQPHWTFICSQFLFSSNFETTGHIMKHSFIIIWVSILRET